MNHVAELFAFHVLGGFHRTRFANAAQVVTGQVHEHQVFGAFLRVALQVLHQGFIFGIVLAAAAGACNRVNGRNAFTHTHEAFGRGTDKLMRTVIEEEHVRRRVYRAEAAVNVKCFDIACKLDAAGRYGLHDVACDDVLLQGFDLFHVFLAGLFQVGHRNALAVLLFGGEVAKVEVSKAGLHLFNGSLQVDLVFFIIQGEQVKLFGKVVEHDVDVPHQEFRLGDVEFVHLRGEANGIATGAEFVAEVAHARRGNRNLVRRHRIFSRNQRQGIKNIALAFLQKHAFLAIDNDAYVLVVLAQTEAFVHHQGRIAAATVGETCGFENCLRTELLAQRKRGVTFTGERHVDAVGTRLVTRLFCNVLDLVGHFDPLVLKVWGMRSLASSL